jgi:hypothetical protein
MPTIESKLVDLELEIKIEREASYLFTDGSTEAWVPKSLVEVHSDGVVTMPSWKAKEVGFL